MINNVIVNGTIDSHYFLRVEYLVINRMIQENDNFFVVACVNTNNIGISYIPLLCNKYGILKCLR